MRILIVEDNIKIAQNIKTILEHHSYSVDVAGDGDTGERMANSSSYDLIILDIMLPKKDGLAICKSLRANDINTPILILTAMGEIEDKIEGLDSGADDYLVASSTYQGDVASTRDQAGRSIVEHRSSYRA